MIKVEQCNKNATSGTCRVSSMLVFNVLHRSSAVKIRYSYIFPTGDHTEAAQVEWLAEGVIEPAAEDDRRL